jgi:predicted DNA-binding transcriptional regulator AlpA
LEGEKMSEGGTRMRRLLSRAEVAELLHISTRTLDRMSASGRLPAPIKVTDRIPRWDDRVIEQFLASRTGAA